ncbi:hypothetical protein C8R44DRAFT_31456 [Mycena epipterygia]|nr:hypothetical protein C8R44DRAFT_31456 [Mycena epipterygia]
MVLTRRASKSIARWLPNELLSEVMLHLSQPDLVALCKTTRLTSGLAIPLLYRAVVLSTLPEIENFLYTLKRHADSPVPRTNYIRKFSLQSLKLELPPDLVKDITSLLMNLPNLLHLDLLLSLTQFPDTLRHTHFPHLSTFHSFVSPDTAALLSAFINRHPTITELHLNRTTLNIPKLPPIHLPHLTQFFGTSSFVPSLVGVVDANSLRLMHVEWFPDDLEMDAALTALSRMVASWHVLVAHFDDIAVSVFLDRLAAHMPKVGIIAFRGISSPSGRISLDDAREIATKLGKFTALASLEFLGFEDDNESLTDSEREDTDIEIVACWAAACKTLVQVHLHGDEWRHTRMGWEIVN